MRGHLVFALAAVTLSSAVFADETMPPQIGMARNAEPSPSQISEASYPHMWQQRLLAVQTAFAARLLELDHTETGGIIPRAK